jgi:DNA-binding LacI/PurR family transcriptional regulator
MANIREIAKKAKCSPATVSRILSGRSGDISISEKTRARIMEICREHDYHPSIHATRLFSKTAKTIGFLYGGVIDFYNENRSISLSYVTEALSEHGYRLLPFGNNTAFREKEEYISVFKRGEIDGLIVWGASEKNHSYLKALNDTSFPVLYLTNKMPGRPSVYSEQRTMIEAMTRACIERGARKLIGIMPEDGYCLHERREGFLAAAQGHSFEIISPHALNTDNQSIQASMLAACEAAYQMNPDAIVCANDENAVYQEMFLLSKGVRIPEDIMITGGDNLKLSEFCPVPLTTFDPMTERCARESVRIMLDHLEKKTPLRSQEIPSQLIWRKSLPK